jgi:hypothetical protein
MMKALLTIALVVVLAVILGVTVVCSNASVVSETRRSVLEQHSRCLTVPDDETIAVIIHARPAAIGVLHRRLLPQIFSRAHCAKRIHVYITNATRAVTSALATGRSRVTVIPDADPGLVVREVVQGQRYLLFLDPEAVLGFDYDRIAVASLSHTRSSVLSSNGRSSSARVSDYTFVDSRGRIGSRPLMSGGRVFEQVIASPVFIFGERSTLTPVFRTSVRNPVRYSLILAIRGIATYTIGGGVVWAPNHRPTLMAAAVTDEERELVHSLSQSRMARLGLDPGSVDLAEIQAKYQTVTDYNVARVQRIKARTSRGSPLPAVGAPPNAPSPGPSVAASAAPSAKRPS